MGGGEELEAGKDQDHGNILGVGSVKVYVTNNWNNCGGRLDGQGLYLLNFRSERGDLIKTSKTLRSLNRFRLILILSLYCDALRELDRRAH